MIMKNIGYKILTISLTLIVVIMVIAYSSKAYNPRRFHQSNNATYVSGSGTSGTANTAMTVITRSIDADALSIVGDRMRIRIYFFKSIGSPMDVTVALNGVPISDVTLIGGPNSPGLAECWLHYIDNTHSNIIEQEPGVGNLTATNVAGFSWNTSMNITVSQNAIASNFITVYGVFVDVLPNVIV